MLIVSDPGPDPDDVKAILIASVLHRKRQLKLRGIVANGGSEPRERAALAKCILNHVNVHDVPVGVGKPTTQGSHAQAHERDIDGFADVRRDMLEDGHALMMRVLLSSPAKSLTVLCISSLRDFADAIICAPDVVKDKVCVVAIQGGLQYDDESGRWQPDTSVNNEFDPQAAELVYSFCFQHGLPMRIVSRNAVPKIPMQLARSFALKHESPVMSYLANAQFLGLKGLWQKLCAGELPARCTKLWYAETFCGLTADTYEATGFDAMGPDVNIVSFLDGSIKPYDVVALMTVLPLTQDLFTKRAVVNVSGVNHLLLLRAEHMIMERQVLEVLRYTYHEVVLVTQHAQRRSEAVVAPTRNLQSAAYFCPTKEPGSPANRKSPDFHPLRRGRRGRGGQSSVPDAPATWSLSTMITGQDSRTPAPASSDRRVVVIEASVSPAVLAAAVATGTAVLLLALAPMETTDALHGAHELHIGPLALRWLLSPQAALPALMLRLVLGAVVASTGSRSLELVRQAAGQAAVLAFFLPLGVVSALTAAHAAWELMRAGALLEAIVASGRCSCTIAAHVAFAIRLQEGPTASPAEDGGPAFASALAALLLTTGVAGLPDSVLGLLRCRDVLTVGCGLMNALVSCAAAARILADERDNATTAGPDTPGADSGAAAPPPAMRKPPPLSMRLVPLASEPAVDTTPPPLLPLTPLSPAFLSRPGPLLARPPADDVPTPTSPWALGTLASRPLPAPLAREPATPGAAVADVYVIQSFLDDAAERTTAIAAWAEAFKLREGREPIIWLQACVDNAAVTGDAVDSIPTRMARSRRLLLLCGPTTFENLRCAVECYMWLATGGSLQDVDVRTVTSKEADLANVVASIDVFAVMYCRPVNPAEKTALEMIVQVAGVDLFNEAVRSFFPIVRHTVTRLRSPRAARRSVVQITRSFSSSAESKASTTLAGAAGAADARPPQVTGS